MSILTDTEALLFVAGRPLEVKEIAKRIGSEAAEVEKVLVNLTEKYSQVDSGLTLFKVDGQFQLGTNPDCSAVVEDFTAYEISEELTKAQLETLTVVAYLGPITRPQIEQIRGVNCAVILRTLLIAGLIEEKESVDSVLSVYSVTLEALMHLGLKQVSELPDYESLHNHENLSLIRENLTEI